MKFILGMVLPHYRSIFRFQIKFGKSSFNNLINRQ